MKRKKAKSVAGMADLVGLPKTFFLVFSRVFLALLLENKQSRVKDAIWQAAITLP
jgi:hypothetical protein